MTTPAAPQEQALQAALAAEHQAVFGYGLLGPRLSGSSLQLAVSSSTAHEQLRDDAAAALAAAGLTPVAALPDYPGLYPVTTVAQALMLAVRLEQSCTSAWRYVYLQAASVASGGDREARRKAQQALTDAAVRAAQWRNFGGSAHIFVAFPGVTD